MKVFLTVPPAVELVLQPGDGVPQGLVLLLLSLILLLPLFCCQLNIHSDSVLDGLCSERGEKYDNLDKRDIIFLQIKQLHCAKLDRAARLLSRCRPTNLCPNMRVDLVSASL